MLKFLLCSRWFSFKILHILTSKTDQTFFIGVWDVSHSKLLSMSKNRNGYFNKLVDFATKCIILIKLTTIFFFCKTITMMIIKKTRLSSKKSTANILIPKVLAVVVFVLMTPTVDFVRCNFILFSRLHLYSHEVHEKRFFDVLYSIYI